jgi:hypothetical protein
MHQDQTVVDHRKPLLTKSEYASLWEVSVRTVDSWIAAGTVKFIRRGHVVRVVNDLIDGTDEAAKVEVPQEQPV